MSSKYHLMPKVSSLCWQGEQLTLDYMSVCRQVELHAHSDGSCRLSTLQELSRQHGCPYPHDDLEKFREVVTLTKPSPSLQHYLSVFGAISNILRSASPLLWKPPSLQSDPL